MVMGRRRAVLAVAGLVTVSAALVWRWVQAGPEKPMTEAERVRADAGQRKAEVYKVETDVTRALFQRMEEPKPGDWLAWHPEPGQLAREYAKSYHACKTPGQNKIYLVPLDELTPNQGKCVDVMARYVEVFFDCKVAVTPMALPRKAYNKARGQVDARQILAMLDKQHPTDALVYAGIAGVDLYRPGLNFVFGIGRVSGVLGVYSLYRYGDDYPTLLRRALKVANHEMGHVLGLRHCVFYDCSMNGSNSLAESDGRPIHYCPECHEKLRLAVGFDPAERFRKLAAFYQRIGFKEDARFVRSRMAHHSE
jgi:archaemetzincin